MGYTKLKDNGAEVAVEATNKVRIVGGILWGSEVANKPRDWILQLNPLKNGRN